MKLRRILGLALFSMVSVGLALATETPSLWIDVPFVEQVRNGCGSAAIAMVMEYWEKKTGHGSTGSADADIGVGGAAPTCPGPPPEEQRRERRPASRRDRRLDDILEV